MPNTDTMQVNAKMRAAAPQLLPAACAPAIVDARIERTRAGTLIATQVGRFIGVRPTM